MSLSSSDRDKQENLDELCHALSENHPNTTEANLCEWYPDMCDRVAVQVGGALRGNTVLTDLTLNVGSMTISGASRGLTHFISHGTSLRKLAIYGSFGSALLDDKTNVNVTVERAVVDQLLLRAGFSGRITHLHICCWRGSATAFAACLLGLRASLEHLVIDGVFGEIDDEEQDDATQLAHHDALANAMHGLNALETLNLFDFTSRLTFTTSIMNGLVGHLRLQELVFFWRRKFDGLCSDAFRRLLMSSTPLQKLTLVSCDRTGMDFDEIGLSGIVGHKTLRELSLHWYGALNGTDGGVHIADMLRNNQSVEDLTIVDGIISPRGLATILEPLTGSNQTLKRLRLVCGELDNLDDDEKDELQRLEVEGYEMIANLLPKVTHLKTLDLKSFVSPGEGPRTALVRAFERNSSLTGVHGDFFFGKWEHDFFEKKYRDRFWWNIGYYFIRNEYREQLDAASTTEMLTIFQDLQTRHCDTFCLDGEYLHDTPLSIIFENLRARANWYTTNRPPQPSSTHEDAV